MVWRFSDRGQAEGQRFLVRGHLAHLPGQGVHLAVVGPLEIANRNLLSRDARNGVTAKPQDHVGDAETRKPDDEEGAEDLADPSLGE